MWKGSAWVIKGRRGQTANLHSSVKVRSAQFSRIWMQKPTEQTNCRLHVFWWCSSINKVWLLKKKKKNYQNEHCTHSACKRCSWFSSSSPTYSIHSTTLEPLIHMWPVAQQHCECDPASIKTTNPHAVAPCRSLQKCCYHNQHLWCRSAKFKLLISHLSYTSCKVSVRCNIALHFTSLKRQA